MSWRRVVVNTVGDPAHGQLAESQFVERTYLTGGDTNLYHVAFAARSLGYEVELRGWLHRPTFDVLASATGVTPQVELPSRLPEAGELVIVPEGWREAIEYGRLTLSPAHTALYILAAPGLFGWPFAPAWSRPDPLTVPLDAVARPEHFTAPVALGFRLLTHSRGIVAAAAQAGVECTFIGNGHPDFSQAPEREKSVDAAAIMDNRWAPLCEQVIAGLDPEITVDRIEPVSNQEMLERLSRARTLIWPSRIEGHAKILWEARSLGCVPVALGSNRFATGLDADHGSEVVETVEEIAPTIAALLGEPERLSKLARRGRETAPAEVDWDAYVKRLGDFLAQPPSPDPGRPARAGIGAALRAWEQAQADAAQTRLEEVAAQLEMAGRDLTAATERAVEVEVELEVRQRELERRRVELERRRVELERLTRELGDLRSRRSVRTALSVAKMLRR